MRSMFRAVGFCALSAFAVSPALAATNVPVPRFSGISLEGGGHITLKYGTEQRVTLIRGSADITDIEVTRSHNLKIEACNNNCPNHYELEIEIVTPDVNALAVKGGGDIVSGPGFPKQAEISVAVAGGGGINLRNVSADQVNAAVNGGGGIKVRAERQLNAAVNGGGGIVYWGNPEVMQAVRGGGSISQGS